MPPDGSGLLKDTGFAVGLADHASRPEARNGTGMRQSPKCQTLSPKP